MTTYVTVPLLAEIVRRTPESIYQAGRSGRIPTKYVGTRSIRIPLMEALDGLRVERPVKVSTYLARQLVREQLGLPFYLTALDHLAALLPPEPKVKTRNPYTNLVVNLEDLDRLIEKLRPEARDVFNQLWLNDPRIAEEMSGSPLLD